jgi:hypothetical protein
VIPPFPLQWPEGFPRYAASRGAGSFKTGLSTALNNVRDSLRLFGSDSGRPVADIVITSNVTLGGMVGGDPGIAVWFMWDGEQRCIAVDRYAKPEANLQAVHHILEARRVELRHGTLALIRATMKGFALSLPAPGKKPWWQVLQINAAYRRLAAEHHPDRQGGSEAMMADLNAARDAARKERA